MPVDDRAGGRQRRLRRLHAAPRTRSGVWARRRSRSTTRGSRASHTRSSLVTSTGGTIEHHDRLAAETPDADLGFYGADGAARALRRRDPGGARNAVAAVRCAASTRAGLRVLMALTVGLLAFLASTRCSRASMSPARAPRHSAARCWFSSARASRTSRSSAIDALAARRAASARRRGGTGRGGSRCWSRSGSGCTTSARAWRSAPRTQSGALALGAFLVIGFAIHNTTEGLAIVAPVAAISGRASLGRLVRPRAARRGAGDRSAPGSARRPSTRASPR